MDTFFHLDRLMFSFVGALPEKEGNLFCQTTLHEHRLWASDLRKACRRGLPSCRARLAAPLTRASSCRTRLAASLTRAPCAAGAHTHMYLFKSHVHPLDPDFVSRCARHSWP